MMKPRTRNAARLLLALLLAVTAAMAAAQEIDPRARELLEGLGHAPQPVRNMVSTTSTLTYMGDQTLATTSHSVVDFENERAIITTSMQGMETSIVIKDGTVTMRVMGMQMPAPPGATEGLENIFEQKPGQALLDTAVRATFDGPVSYGDLLSGDQVTFEGDATIYGSPEAAVQHYVFRGDGALLGVHVPTTEGEMLMVYNEPVVSTRDLMEYDMKMYLLTDGAWQLMTEMKVESMEFDVEIDESLFQ